MNVYMVHLCADRISYVLARDFPGMRPSDVVMALFGVLLAIGRNGGVSDFALHQGFGSFLEDNAE